ncbi:MAG: YceI family protein, partial [Cytophagales bacterium]|nr:YceI family protein [Cytophagales bacterium]
MIKLSLYVLVCIASLITTPIFAQKRYMLEKAEISFVSNADLEVIKASSKSVKGILDTLNKQFAFSIPVKSFNGFNSALQQEHFNENYMESEKFPSASFSGKIIEQLDFSRSGSYEVRAKGELDIHGQKQIRIIKIKLQVKNGTL